MELLNLPTTIFIGLVAAFAVMQGIGMFLDFRGKIVPEFMYIKKYFARRKKERETMEQIPAMIENFERLLESFESHYSADNIAMRDGWMKRVNDSMNEFQDIKDIVLDIQINTKRRDIIEFANRAINMDVDVSKEEYERIFALHDEYEEIIKKHNLTNGQVKTSYELVQKSYEERAKTRNFIECKVR